MRSFVLEGVSEKRNEKYYVVEDQRFLRGKDLASKGASPALPCLRDDEIFLNVQGVKDIRLTRLVRAEASRIVAEGYPPARDHKSGSKKS